MAREVIYIEDQQLDGVVNQSTATYSIEDANRISVRKNSVSGLLIAPDTPNNRAIFGNPKEVNSASAITQKMNVTGSIEYNGVTIIKGRVKFLKPVTKNGVTEYHFYIVGDNADWRTQLEEMTLQEVDLVDQDHEYTKANIDLSETVDPARMYVYPLFNRGLFGDVWFYNNEAGTTLGNKNLHIQGSPPEYQNGDELVVYSIGGEEKEATYVSHQTIGGDNYIVVNTSQADNQPLFAAGAGRIRKKDYTFPKVRVTDRTPAINLARLIRRSFAQIGYKVESQFIDTQLDSIYIHHVPDKFGLDAEELGYKVGTSGDHVVQLIPDQDWQRIPFNDAAIPFFNNGSHYDTAAYEYIVAQNGRYRFNADLQVSLGANTFNSSFERAVLVSRTNGTTEIISQQGTLNSNMWTAWVELEFGDRVWVGIKRAQDGTTISRSITILELDTFFRNQVRQPIDLEGDNISLNKYLPEVSVATLLSGVKHLFNLYFATNAETRTVYLEPRDSFYTEKVVDISGLIDVSATREKEEIGTDMAKVQRYQYGTDSADALAKRYLDDNGVPLHSVDIELGNVFASNQVDENQNPLFNPTYMDTVQQGTAIGILETEIPRAWIDPDGLPYPKASISQKSRVLKYDGIEALQADQWNFEGDIRTDLPRFYSHKVDEYSLSSLRYDNLTKSPGLVAIHYASQIREINEGHILTLNLCLNENHVAGFSTTELNTQTLYTDTQIMNFRSKLWLDIDNEGAYFRMHKIDRFKAGTGQSTKCELIKVVDKAVLPVFPQAFFTCQYQVDGQGELQAGGTMAVVIYVYNTGGVAGSATVTINCDGLPSFAQTKTVQPNSFQQYFKIYTLPSNWAGSYSLQVGGTCTFSIPIVVNGCTTPAELSLGSPLTLNPSAGITEGDTVEFSFSVQNTGCLDGDWSGQITIRDAYTGDILGFWQWNNVNIPAGEQVVISRGIVMAATTNLIGLARAIVETTDQQFYDDVEFIIDPLPAAQTCLIDIQPSPPEYITASSSISQSFQACMTGSVISIGAFVEVVGQGTDDIYVEIYEGDFDNLGSFVYGFNLSTTEGQYAQGTIQAGLLNVTQAQTYIVVFNSPNGILNIKALCGGDGYTLGRCFVSGGTQTGEGKDMNIQIDITEN